MEWTKHLTARTDDDHAAPVKFYYNNANYATEKENYIQKLVRYLAYYRIK